MERSEMRAGRGAAHAPLPTSSLTLGSHPLPVKNGYRIHTSRLRRGSKADSVNRRVICGSSQWLGSNMDWGGLATAVWKKGGLVASGPGSATGSVHPATWRHACAGDAIHAFPAQWVGDGGRDGELRCGEDSRVRGGA